MEIGKKKKRKDEQHIVPRTYLKHWRIGAEKNFVYGIDFSNKYKKGVQTFGLSDKVFKRRRYYNDSSLSNPYIIEDVLGQDIEPEYENIMSEVNKEQNLSYSIRGKLIQWLYVSKMRSPYMRDSIEEMAKFINQTTERFRDKNISEETEKSIENQSKQTAKRVQLSAFADKEQVKQLFTLFLETLNAKHWRILKSVPQFQFWTNDNPGFSPNTVERFAKNTPYHHVMELNADSIILFPLSPDYCLEITPFESSLQLDVCALTMEIKYEQASPYLIEYINKGVLFTRSKVVISNNKDNLEYCIQRK